MSVRKYLFWICDDGIKTYKATEKGTFELLRPAGRDVFREKDLSKFFLWFHKSAAITEDEFIDFCFLSEQPIELPLLQYTNSTKSYWNKQEIDMFCDKFIGFKNYEIYYAENKKFVYQKGNVLDEDKIKKMYIKCIPEISIEVEEKIDLGADEISLLNRFFIERLKELDNK